MALRRATQSSTAFYGTGVLELDLFVVRGTTRLGLEVKRTSAPKITPSMRVALEDLHIDRLDVLYAGTETYPLTDRIRAVPVHRIWHDVDPS